MRSSRMMSVGHVVLVWGEQKYIMFGREMEEKRPFGKPIRR
jgi:hypothetical protein